MAGGYLNAHNVATPLLVSVYVRQQEELSTLEERVDALAGRCRWMCDVTEIGFLETVENRNYAEDVKGVRLIGARGTVKVDITDESMAMFAEAGEDVFKAIHNDMADLQDEFDHWEHPDKK